MSAYSSFNISTPWGPSQHITKIGDQGILFVSTTTHGGYFVPPELYAQMPSELRSNHFGGSTWFEEDVEWAMVALAFPQLFLTEEHLKRKSLLHALATLLAYLPENYKDCPWESPYIEAAKWTQRNETSLTKVYNEALSHHRKGV